MAPKFVVVGGGLAGLMTVIKLCEAGHSVDLISLVPVKRSHSVCAQGGINGAVNTKGEGDSPWEHFDDTVYGGDFLANQSPVKAMCEDAPAVIYMFDRMGVPFNRTPEGLIDFRRFGGTQHHRTAFSGATTGQQLLYALDEQVRRWEVQGQVRKYEGWDFLGAILHDGRAVGVTAQNMATMEIKAFPADAVVMATGGIGMVFGKSTNSVINTGTSHAILFNQGVKYGNPEMIQVHPTSIPGNDKLRLMSESIRGEGGRVWTYKDGKPWYFLEEMYPAYGNLVPRDVATRAIYKVCVEMGLGVDGKNQVFLDLTHKDPHELERKLGGVIEIYQKFVGDDPKKVPMKIFPGMHYSMGGMWVDFGEFKQQTNIQGLFAVGECEYQYHGANRLGANSLLSCVTEGRLVGPDVARYVKALGKSVDTLPATVWDEAVKEQQAKYNTLLRMDGTENAYVIHDELGKLMTENCTVVRYNDKLQATVKKIEELKQRWKNIGVPDHGGYVNQPAIFTRWLHGMLDLGHAIALGALLRNESRGAHYKPEFQERDDENFMKTTIATKKGEGWEISYEEIEVSHIPPRKRNYTVKKEEAKAAH